MSDVARSEKPKKKKKKAKQSKGFLIGLIGGGAALVVGVIVLIVVLSSGGKGSDKPKDEPKKDKDVAAGYKRPMKEDEALAKLKEIGQAYHKYVEANTRGPSGHGQFEKFLRPELSEMIATKPWINMMYNWLPGTLLAGAGKTLVAWEMQPFEGKRVVLYGDASAAVLTEEEYGKAPRVDSGGEIIPGPLVPEGGKTRLGKYVRAITTLEMETTLRNIGLSYVQFELDNKRGPKELRDLSSSADPLVRGALDSKDGWLVFIWNAEKVADPSRTIIAYERDSIGGQRYVVFGNGSFDAMNDSDFAVAPRAKAKAK
jgi:hypothetical protein